jgi:hypothetical protein
MKCGDGVVVGSDGAATFCNISQTRIQQPVRKLSIIDGNIIVGASGPIGIGQAYAFEIGRLSKAGNFKKNPEKILSDIRAAVWPYVEKEWKGAEVAGKVIGPQVAQSAFSYAVVAMSFSDRGSLFQFNHQCSPEEAAKDLPFIAIGSGQHLADPFLAFLRRIFWPKTLPILPEGILATMWSLEHAILTNAGGVSRPIQIITLSKGKDGKGWAVTELSEEDLGEHRQNMLDAEQALANCRKGQQAASEDAVAPPPMPPPA